MTFGRPGGSKMKRQRRGEKTPHLVLGGDVAFQASLIRPHKIAVVMDVHGAQPQQVAVEDQPQHRRLLVRLPPRRIARTEILGFNYLLARLRAHVFHEFPAPHTRAHMQRAGNGGLVRFMS